MNERLIATLESLMSNPALAAQLYEHLFNASFWTIAWRSGADARGYVGCQKADGTWEIPVFTQPNRSLLRRLTADIPAAECVGVDGQTMWRQLLEEYMNDSKTQVAVDPGEEHGVLLTRVMILGMVNKYGNADGRTA